MKVCLISGEYPPMQGGVGDYTRELGRTLAAQAVEVCIVTSTRAAPDHASGPVVVRPLIEQWDWSCWWPILSQVRQNCADVLHIQYQAAAYAMHPAINFLPLFLRLLRAIQPTRHLPLGVTTYHDLRVPYLFPKAGRLRWWVTLALARWSDATVVTNAEDWATLRSHRRPGSPAVDPALIPIGSNIAPNPPQGYDRLAWREQWGVEADETLLSYFGFLNESKGGETLIQGLAELVRSGLPVKLLMVGGQVGDSDPTNVPYLRKVRKLIDDLGLSDSVLWTGFTPDEEVSANLLASDICVLPYRDGASFRRGSFMAALAHGLPIVTTHPAVQPSRQAYLPHLKDGENVRLVPSEDAAALARAIIALMADPSLRRHLAQGAATLAAHFTWDHIARQTLDVYTDVLSTVKRGS